MCFKCMWNQKCYSGSRSGARKNVYETAIKSPFHVPRKYHSSLKRKKNFFSCFLVRDSKFMDRILPISIVVDCPVAFESRFMWVQSGANPTVNVNFDFCYWKKCIASGLSPCLLLFFQTPINEAHLRWPHSQHIIAPFVQVCDVFQALKTQKYLQGSFLFRLLHVTITIGMSRSPSFFFSSWRLLFGDKDFLLIFIKAAASPNLLGTKVNGKKIFLNKPNQDHCFKRFLRNKDSI